MPLQLICKKCGANGPWLQVKADPGGRLGVREILFKGLSALPAGWRSVHPSDAFAKKDGFFCCACKARASADIAEIFEQTPNLQGEPLVFVDPVQVDLTAEVAAIKQTYREGVVTVLDSEARRAAKQIRVSSLKWLHPSVVEALGRKFGVPPSDVKLYVHQQRVIEALVRDEGSVMIATSTSSGKSLCFQVPWLHDISTAIRGQASTAIYLAPLNALIDDQFRSLTKFSLPAAKGSSKSLAEKEGFLAVIDLGSRLAQIAQYHGGVPTGDVRHEIKRAKPEFVFTNPEMLSKAILAYALDVDVPGAVKKSGGGAWEYLFRRLRYVILDECHELKGVYGSHVANLLRRLRRICALAGNPDANKLRYVLCSATIREPGKFAERLTGIKPKLVIDHREDTSERYQKKLVFLRRRDPQQPMKEFARGVLGKVFSNRRLRTIAFQESIPAVEELHDRFTTTLEKDGLSPESFQVFTANFLPDERIAKLEQLRSGAVPGVVSTSALALGIDIGSLSCAALITYPGSIAKAWQMLGRAGRKGPGLQLFLLGDGFLDRFWEEHPDEFLDHNKHLEELVIMPDNPHILAEHVAAAHFDHPLELKRDEPFFGTMFRSVVRDLLNQGGLIASRDEDDNEYFELSDQDRVFRIGLRGTGAFKVRVCLGSIQISEEDQVRAIRRLYPGAIFLHDKSFYRVLNLEYVQEKGRRRRKEEFEQRRFVARVQKVSRDKVTVPIVRTEIESLEEFTPRERKLGMLTLALGRVRIKTSVDEYYEVPYDPSESESEVAISGELGETPEPKRAGIRKFPVKREPGKTPTSHVYETDGMWIVVPDEAFADIEGDEARYSALFSVGKAITRAIPLLHYSGPDDLLFTPYTSHIAANEHSALFIYERTRGGVGLAEKTFERLDELLNNALYEVIEGCKRCRKERASQGCPGCIADISGFHDRSLAIRLLENWLDAEGRHGKRCRSMSAKRSSTPCNAIDALKSVGFEQIQEIGEGGMEKVFTALRDGQRWALKIASESGTSKDKRVEIAREGLRQKRLAKQWREHTGILPVHDVITIEPFVFLQLEYADGGSLQDKIGPIGWPVKNF